MEDTAKLSTTSYLLEDQTYQSYGVHTPRRQSIMNAVKLQPEVSKVNFVCGMIHYALIAFSFATIITLQPFLILSQNYFNIQQKDSGILISLIVVIQIIMKVCLSTVYRRCTEKFGRKGVIFFGGLSFLLGCILLPLQKSIFPGLIISNLLISNGNAAISVIPLFADSIADDSKARAAGFSTLFMGVAALLANLFIKILFYAEASLTACSIITGGIVFVGLVVNSFGITERGYYDQERPLPQESYEGNVSQEYNVSEAIQNFRTNGWALIALILQALGSSNFFIFFTFVTLYIKSKFSGYSDENSQDIIVNNIQTLIFAPSLLFNVIYGYFINKQTRAFGLSICILLGGICSFILMAVAQDPDDGYIIVGCLLMGITIPGFNIIAGYLGVRNFPTGVRMIMIGIMGLVGAFGYFLTAIVGGLLYEYWSTNGIFIIGAIIFGISLIVITIIYKIMISVKRERNMSWASNNESMFINNA